MVDMDSDANSEYDKINDYYIHMHTEPVQAYYVTPQQASEGAVKQNKEKEGVQYRIQQKFSVVQWTILTIVLLVSICALGLSIGVFLDGAKHGNELKTMSMKITSEVLIQLNNISCDGCVHRSDQDIYHTSTSQALNSLQNLYHELNCTVHEVDNRHQLKQNTIHQMVDPSVGCRSDIVSICTINHNNVGTPPTSATCETGPEPLEIEGFQNVNIFCSVDSGGETNPVTSTLSINQGEVSCLCSLVALTAPTTSIECRITIQRCPETIMSMFNVTE